MSIPVELQQLAATITDFHRQPYLLTVGDDDRPHSVAVNLRWRDEELEIEVGKRTLANTRSRPLVSLLWPPDEPGAHSLIVDAAVTLTEGTGPGDNVLRVRPTRAVLHRPATEPTDGDCQADCVPILAEDPSRSPG